MSRAQIERRAQLQNAKRKKRSPETTPGKEYVTRYATAVAHAYIVALATEDFESLANLRTDDRRTPQMAALAGRIQAKFAEAMTASGVDKLARGVANRIEAVNAEDLSRMLAIAPSQLPPIEVAARWQREQRAFVKDLGQDAADRVTSILQAAPRGLRVQDLAARIARDGEILKSRATLIARDQTLKLYADIDRARQQRLGIAKYIWRSSGDGATRSHHTDLDGLVFSWGEPPEGGGSRAEDSGHPGEGVQCRCTAEPVLDDG